MNTDLLQKYQSNRVGVRNEPELHFVCLDCGTNDCQIEFKASTECQCQMCGFWWRFSKCWSCKSAYVDSRDPVTPECEDCGWQKCSFCKACNWNGCSTNPYSLTRCYVDNNDNIADTLAYLHSLEDQEELKRHAAGYGLNLDGEDVSYNAETGMFSDGDNHYPG